MESFPRRGEKEQTEPDALDDLVEGHLDERGAPDVSASADETAGEEKTPKEWREQLKELVNPEDTHT